MNKPKSIQKAFETIAGFCNKHKSCDGCILKDFCDDTKYRPPCYWADEQQEGSEADNG